MRPGRRYIQASIASEDPDLPSDLQNRCGAELDRLARIIGKRGRNLFCEPWMQDLDGSATYTSQQLQLVFV